MFIPRSRRIGFLCLALLSLSLAAHAQQPPSTQSRLLVLTDIEADPDDTQSLVRLLLYSNEIDLEGLVATTSIHMQSEIHPDSIRAVINAYDRVRANLLKHAPGYPAGADLLKRVVEGQPSYGMAAVGKGKDTAGSQLILRALESPDPRPLWVTAWGGPNTLAQALFSLREARGAEAAAKLVAKLRVHTISDQDDSGAWMRREFPTLFYIVSPGGYGGATWTGIHTMVPTLGDHPINQVISKYNGQIYQYAGDEIVILWSQKEGMRNLSCIRFFFACTTRFAQRSEYYLQQFGQVPHFKAGLHLGKVTAVEVGDLKRDIAYHGDTINTAARIHSVCQQYGQPFILSHTIVGHQAVQEFYDTTSLGLVALKGKSMPVELFSIRPRSNSLRAVS